MSTAEPTTFPIDGDSSGFVAAIDKARAAMTSMIGTASRTRSALDGVQSEAAQTAKALDKVAETSSAASKAGGILGGQLGGLISNLGDLDELLNSGLDSTQKFALGAAVAATALVGVGAAALDAVVNLDDYRDTIAAISQQDLITESQIAGLESAHDAFIGLHGGAEAFRLFLGSSLAPALEDFAKGTIALQAGAVRTATLLANIGEGWDAAWEAADRAAAAVWVAARAAIDADEQQAASAGSAAETRVRATRAHTSAIREQADAVSFLTDAEIAAFEEEDQRLAAMSAALSANQPQAQTMGGPDWSARFNAAQDATLNGGERWASSWQDSFAVVEQGAAALFDTLGKFAENYVHDDSERAKRAARAAYAVGKASALAQAALAIPLAVLGQLSTPGPAGLAGAIIAGVTGAAQLAAIAASPPPQFHRGGLVGDEVPATLRAGEVVLTERGARAAGLTDTGAIDRANAGQSSAPPVVAYLMVGDQAIGPLRGLASGPQPGYGQRRR